MAGPHVVGLVALLISANPALAGQVDELEAIVSSTAVPLTPPPREACGPNTVPNHTFGHGRIDAHAAVLAALARLPAQVPGLPGSAILPVGVLLGALGRHAARSSARRSC